MKVIIFRKNNKITSIQSNGINDETPELIKKFNKEHLDSQAKMHELNELELHLYENRKAKISDFKETLQEILCAVENLDSNLEWLEKICKDGEY